MRVHTRSLSVYSICRCQTLRITVAGPKHSIYKAWDLTYNSNISYRYNRYVTVAGPPRSIYKAWDYTYNSNISYRHTRDVKAIERREQTITILYT